MTAPFPVPGGEAHAQVDHDFVTLPKPEFRTPGWPEHFIDGYGRAHSLDCRGCRIDALTEALADATAFKTVEALRRANELLAGSSGGEKP